MKFLIDAQLPPVLKFVFQAYGHDAIHSLDLPLKNDTPDTSIRQIAQAEGRVVVTKDTDFYYSHFLTGSPVKLVLVRTGNIRVKPLKALFENDMGRLIRLLETHDFVEITGEALEIE